MRIKDTIQNPGQNQERFNKGNISRWSSGRNRRQQKSVTKQQLNPFVPTVPTFAVRETASLGIMGEPRVPPLNPSESIVLSGPLIPRFYSQYCPLIPRLYSQFLVRVSNDSYAHTFCFIWIKKPNNNKIHAYCPMIFLIENLLKKLCKIPYCSATSASI